MKDLLYLKDDQIKEFIQLLYYAYRETFSDPREILSKKYFGPAHLRALNLIERNPGINLGELIFKLKITKTKVSTFRMSEKSTDPCQRPMPACSLVSFKHSRRFLRNVWLR